MTQHTPGPWSANGTEVVAEVGIAVANITGSLSNDSSLADARLIASAPEMLATLESIVAREHIMEREFGQSFAARVRRVVKAAKGE